MGVITLLPPPPSPLPSPPSPLLPSPPSLQQAQCIMTYSLSQYLQEEPLSEVTGSKVEGLLLRKAPNGTTSSLRFGVHMKVGGASQVHVHVYNYNNAYVYTKFMYLQAWGSHTHTHTLSVVHTVTAYTDSLNPLLTCPCHYVHNEFIMNRPSFYTLIPPPPHTL